MDIVSKIKKANLVGRGGAGFPVALKWLAVKQAAGDRKYVICNASEGEPGIEKNAYIIDRHLERVIDGMGIALEYLSKANAKNKITVAGYFYINNKYYKKYRQRLIKTIGNLPIKIFVKPYDAGYIGGEESAILDAIEGRRVEPRLKPPYPTTNGLWGAPTLVNNVETFYNVSLVASGEYKRTRFYTVSGDCLNNGVYELPENFTTARVLGETKNLPDFPFFVQVGGNASGEFFNSKQLNKPVGGGGSITVYSVAKNDFHKIVKNLLDFYANESCGQCTPCREGIYRLKEIFAEKKVNWQIFNNILDDLSDASFCALGPSIVVPIKSLNKNVFINK